MSIDKLPDMVGDCTPCPEPKPFTPSVKLPETVCPCPEPVEPDLSYLRPTRIIQTVRKDCFGSMLKNMTASKFCTIPPASCNK